MDIECPFCSFRAFDLVYILEHIEVYHPEDKNGCSDTDHIPGCFMPEKYVEGDSQSRDVYSEVEYIQCECSEHVQLSEFTGHLALHASEEITYANPPQAEEYAASSIQTISSIDFTTENSPQRRTSSHRRKTSKHVDHSEQRKVQHFKQSLPGRCLDSSSNTRPSVTKPRHTAPRRLGTAELGPYAYENQMPSWLRNQLETGAKTVFGNKLGRDGSVIRVETKANETRGTISVLGTLCEQDKSSSRVYLCHPDVHHIVKMAKEGGFCGYRNIQMMISFIRNTKLGGYEHFMQSIPSILELQDAIETAWDRGINDFGRIETGGIRGTRKFIGTSEAQALFILYGIGCEANAFGDSHGVSGYQHVLKAVEDYFLGGHPRCGNNKVYNTSLPPLYFQYPGHSMTIVGLEKMKNSSSNLLVLDPMFRPSPAMCLLMRSHKYSSADPEKLLKAYRRGANSLTRYGRFELLKLNWQGPVVEELKSS